MELLETNFNADTLDQVMCRNLISIGWDGSVYDCDFNQMLDLPMTDADGKTLAHCVADLDQVANRPLPSATIVMPARPVPAAVAAAR